MTARRRSIAVIEDDAAVADSVQMVLESQGWRVHAYSSGEQYLADTRGGTLPDCVVLDLALPGIDGPELLSAIETRTLPVIILTAYPSLLPDGHARELGIRAVLLKPASAETLIEAVGQALRPPNAETPPG